MALFTFSFFPYFVTWQDIRYLNSVLYSPRRTNTWMMILVVNGRSDLERSHLKSYMTC